MEPTKLLISIAVLLCALGCAYFYLLRPAARGDLARSPFSGDRPWRRIGAAICLLLAVMFVLGIYLVDIPDRPVPYAIYWIIMLGLVVWLFALAVRDVMYTRRLVERWRKEMDDPAKRCSPRAAENCKP